MHSFTEHALNRSTALWNMHIPRCATRVTVGKDAVRYLHPTKGWRRIARARVGL